MCSHCKRFFEQFAQLVLALSAPFAGGSSSGGGARPDAFNAEQLVVNIECLQDVSRWLATGKSYSSNREMASLREAFAVLTRDPRPKAEEVLRLLSKWEVKQRRQGKNRPLADIIKDLEIKKKGIAVR